ncbi:MAG: ABC transporter permease subunit [Kofleriaceae bacterium]
MWAIALNTFREAARMRVLYAMLAMVVGANLLALVLSQMALRDGARVARDVGLAGISLFGSLTAIFLGVFLLYAEVQRRTIHTIVSKPIERWEFVVGKYLGMGLVLSLLVGLFTAAMLGQLVWQGVPVSSAIVKATILSWAEVMTVASVAIFFSSFSSPFLSGLFALVVFFLGRVTPDIQAAADRAPQEWIQVVARAALRLVPDLQLFSVSGRTLDGEVISVHADFVSWGYVGLASLQGLLWIIGLVGLAAVLFQRRDFT